MKIKIKKKLGDKYFGVDVPMKIRMCRMMTQATTAGLMLDALLRAFYLGFDTKYCLVPILCSIATLIAFTLSLKYDFGGKGYALLLFVSNIIMLPASFLMSGGTSSGNPAWMLLGMAMVYLMLDGITFWLVFVTTAAVDLSLFYIGAHYPNIVIPLDYINAREDAAGSLVVVAMVLGCLFRYQNYLYKQERELSQKRQREIEEISNTKSLFFANMSHEIRTPINTIIGLNEMTLREEISDEVAENSANIQKASKMLLTTINDILDISKLESGNLEIIKTRYDSAALFNDIVNMIWVRAQQKNLELKVDIAEDIPAIMFGDEIRLKQVLTNLLTNAVKYTPKGYVMLTVKGEKSGLSDIRLTISVEDTGIGIRHENIGDLFTVFRQADTAKNKKIEGTGLGLPLSKQLVELMGGKISVDSIYQKGSCFTVTIDQQIVDATPIGSGNIITKRTVSRRESYKQSFEAPEAKVLIVDDNEMNLMVAKKLLRDTKVQVETASSGMECLEKTAKNSYHVILMDHMMPNMDGEETLNAIRKRTDGFCQNTPVIALTANVMTNAAAKYHEMGFDGYLAKPISGSLLEASLKKFIPADFIESSNTDQDDEEEYSSIVFHNRKKKICVTVDGICDLPDEWLEKLNIKLMYYYVITEEGRFIDTREIGTDELLDYISTDRQALSSCPSVDEYEKFFSDRLMEAEQVLHISTASNVGNGFDNATKAAAGFDNVTVIDSGHLSSGMGLIAMNAATMAENGFKLEAIISETEKMRDRVSTSFILPSGESMYRNGRISKGVLKLCSIMQLRPILCLRGSKISLAGFTAGSLESTYAKYVKNTLRHRSRIDDQLIFMTHAGLTVKQLEKIKGEVRSHKEFERIAYQKASSAISCNCGKGCFGLIFIRR